MPPHTWQNWRTTVRFPAAGYNEIRARTTGSEGEMQWFAIDWNPKGYLNNRMHRAGLRPSCCQREALPAARPARRACDWLPELDPAKRGIILDDLSAHCNTGRPNFPQR